MLMEFLIMVFNCSHTRTEIKPFDFLVCYHVSSSMAGEWKRNIMWQNRYHDKNKNNLTSPTMRWEL